MRKFLYGCLMIFITPLLLLAMVLIVAAQFNDRVAANTLVSSSELLAQENAPWPAPMTLKVVTYNIHDLYIGAFDHAKRMQEIARIITELDPDIVGFQEAFIAKHRKILQDALADSRLKHFEYYRSGTAGSGLLIASAWPIQESFYHRYSANNAWYKFWEGDWWAGKGVALARIKSPVGYLDFYNTHAQAGYGNSYYKIIREAQMTGLVGFLRSSHLPQTPGILVGDMNCREEWPDYETAVRGAALVRAMDTAPGIDNIFTMAAPDYHYELLDAKVIEKDFEKDGEVFERSDHCGYLSTIRVSPRRTISENLS